MIDDRTLDEYTCTPDEIRARFLASRRGGMSFFSGQSSGKSVTDVPALRFSIAQNTYNLRAEANAKLHFAALTSFHRRLPTCPAWFLEAIRTIPPTDALVTKLVQNPERILYFRELGYFSMTRLPE